MGQIKPVFYKVLYEGLLEKHYEKDLLAVPSVPAAAPPGPQAASASVNDDRRTAPFHDGRVTLARLPAFHWYKRSYDNALNDRRDELRAERM
jgi:hypothetical protein